MYRTIYVEHDVQHNRRVSSVLQKFPQAEVVYCDRYTEIFNRKSQDFRLQKNSSALILARKHQGHVQSIPPGYGVGGTHNYYFSIMLNCVFDCRYCFLQGMYRSAHHVLFVNYEDFQQAIDEVASDHEPTKQVWFFSGYDCDSLALEPVAEFAGYFIDALQNKKNVWLELRTKSTQIRSLLEREPVANVVTAFSITPEIISNELEHGVPSVRKRISAMQNLQKAGWNVGLRFDPLIYSADFKDQYSELFRSVFSEISLDLLHSVSIGVFRLPSVFYKRMERLYRNDPFMAQPFDTHNGVVSYPRRIEDAMKTWCFEEVNKYVHENRIFFASSECSD